MKKWLKILLLLVALGLVVALIGSGASYYLLTGTPDWYHPRTVSAAERQEAANRAIRKYAGLQSWAADAQAQEARATRGNTTSRYAPVDDELTVAFSQEEINGFLYAWSEQFGWDRWYEKLLQDPLVILQDGRLVLAGKLKSYGAVVSFHFDPTVDADGRLHLNLKRVLGGKLPLPEALWSVPRQRFESALRRRLPNWKRSARIGPDGLANDDAVYGGLAELALGAMEPGGADPVIFLWVANDFTAGTVEARKIPARLTNLSIVDRTLRLTVRRLDAEQRRQYLERLRRPNQTALVQSSAPGRRDTDVR